MESCSLSSRWRSIGFTGLPDFGAYHGVYGRVIDGIGVTLRHGTDLITLLNFDVRAFDTLGEEFILFASVTGVALLLRHLSDEDEDLEQARGIEEHTFAGASDALKPSRSLALGRGGLKGRVRCGRGQRVRPADPVEHR